MIAVNKVDTAKQDDLAAQFVRTRRRSVSISAEHGTGLDGLLDAITADFTRGESIEEKPDVSIAIIGRPNSERAQGRGRTAVGQDGS